MFNKLILFVAVIIGMAGTSYAQKPCATDDVYKRLLQQYPQLADFEEQFNAQLREAVANRTTSVTDTTIYDIPLVVHVVHDYGAENVTDDVIYTAAAYWAVVYMKQNADTTDVIPPFVKWVGNPRMRLHLATIDPNGNPTKGVVRFKSYLTIAADDQAKYEQWPSNKYVNIWLISTFGAAYAGAAAYAYTPSLATFQPYYDGVICLSSYTNQDKTIPHELGHVMNLSHPWGNTNNPGVACGDDQVDDTPPTKGHSPTGCTLGSLYDTACTTGYLKHYTAAGGGDSLVNYPDTTNAQNIMDYTYCQRMFTIGQVVRMRTALLSATAGRNNLFTPSNLAATGALAPMPDLPPVADFIVNRASSTSLITDSRSYFLTFNNTALFSFKNWSWNDTVSSVLWTFSNGASTPTSTNMTTNVTNQFSVPGWVTVSLQATSNAGSNTITNTHTVYAADTVVAGGIGYSQNFSTASSVDNWPMFNYYNNRFQWQYYSGAGYDDGSCVRYRSFDTTNKTTGNAVGDHDDFYTPAFDLSSAPTNTFLNFYTAGASVSSSSLGYGVTAKGDSIEVDVSITGGQRWTRIGSFSGNNLSNNGVMATEFVPTSPGQWKARSITIPATYYTNNTFFRFRYWPGNTGNNMYLDNVSIWPWAAGVQEVLNASSDLFNIFPNPSTNGFNLVFKTGNDGSVNYCIKDLTGKLVYEHKADLVANSTQQEIILRSATPAAGMYFITVTIDGVSRTQKLVVY